VSHVKGSAIASRLRFVREHYGEAGIERLFEQLSPDDRTVVRGHILPTEWISYDLFVAINTAADRLFGKGDLQLCVEMGRYGAKTNLPTIYRLFYRFGTPMFVFRKAAQIWNVHYDSGQIIPVEDERGRIKLSIQNFARPHRAHCLSVLGWAAGSIELAGSTVTLANESACRTQGAPACDLVLQFKD
jgi:hypothetical protein